MELSSAIQESIGDDKKSNDNEMLNSLLITAKSQIQSDWKSKSLDPKPLQKYTIEMKQDVPQVQQVTQEKPSFLKRMFGKNQKKKQSQTTRSQRTLPHPKIAKINDRIFCMAIDSEVKIYFYNKDPKIKRTFDMIDFTATQPIEFVFGNNTEHVFIGHKNKLTILQLERKQGKLKYQIVKTEIRKISGLKGCTHNGKYLYALSTDSVYEFQTSSNTLTQRKLAFKSQEQMKIFNELEPIQLATQNERTLFYFGTKKDQRTLIDMKTNNVSPQSAKKKQCQCLTLVRFTLDKTTQLLEELGVKKTTVPSENNQENQIEVTLFPIDHVFDTGIFMKSKVFVLDNQMFLMELYEEVILIKKHFEKYIVWDNISILSSKSSQKKGQLVLADKRIMVYSQVGQIFAYDIFFNNEQSKLNMPAIDSFKGNQSDQQVLYDAVLLRYSAKTLMKVLFYFKQFDIMRPRVKMGFGGDDKKEGKLNLNIICIVQSDPKQKLLDLLTSKKPAAQIQNFVKRFNISELEKYKSQWTVSKKTIKDIENNLLEIQDDKYIQQELDKILKQKPHDLNFLTIVQKKQIQRLKRLLVRNLLKMNNNQYPAQQSESQIKRYEKQESNQIQYINQVIQWLLQSMMFLKKLNYSKNFLSFKEYDFIEIGKLKAASLKEEIKLLTCKKFEKRLKYFLNSFKYLAIANYQDIFTFLLQNKSEEQLEQFIMSFKFIMPDFIETSQVFIRKMRLMGDINIPQLKSEYTNQLVIGKQSKVIQCQQYQPGEEPCQLWNDKQQQETKVLMTQTLLSTIPGQSRGPKPAQAFSNVENFERMILDEIFVANIDANLNNEKVKQNAVKKFQVILSKFIQTPWFKNSAFKQHATLSISTKQLYEKFDTLKSSGVFNIFVKIIYKKIRQGLYTQDKVEGILDRFVYNKILPESFRKNVEARIAVYSIIQTENNARSSTNPFMSMHYKRDMSLRQDFIIMREDYYFEYLMMEYRNLILKDVKNAYQNIETNFFRERFQIFLKSELIKLKQIIGFMDEFVDNPDDDIRLDVFKCIKTHLKLNDYENAKKFNEKSLDKSIFPDDHLQLDQLKEEAKIPYGFYFYQFWSILNLDMTYQDLIQASHCPVLENNNLLKQIIKRYCNFKYQQDQNGSALITFIQGLSLDRIQPIDIHQNPLGFFGLLLYILDTLSFKVQTVSIFNMIIENYLNNSSFDILKRFIGDLTEFNIQDCNIPSRNFDLLMQFKEQNYINKILCQKFILWVQQSYRKINNLSQIQQLFGSINEALTLVTEFSRQSVIDKEKAFLEMLKLIQKFDENLLLDIEYLRGQLNQTGFIFMLHLIDKGDLSVFDKKNAEAIEDQIYNFYCIYSQFKQASKGQIIDSMQSTELCKFFNELCHKIIKAKYYLSAQRILLKVVGAPIYFRDIVFAFLAQMKYISSQTRSQFISDFLNTETNSLLKKKVTQITQMVDGFQKDPSYFKSSVNGVFKCILQNNKPNQAFFYLIRLPELHLMQTASEMKEVSAYKNKNMEAYLLLTAYIRCLQQHLSVEFYPSFQFYNNKLEMLNAEMDRMDVIKDINIAISRLKDISSQNFESQEKKFNVSKDKSQLQFFYKRFMESIGINHQIKLTDQQFLEASQRIQRYSRHIPPELLNKTVDQTKTRVQLKGNQQKLTKVKKQNKVQVIQKEVAATISQAKRTAEKYSKVIQQRTPVVKRNIAKKTQQEMQKIRRREQNQIQSVKESFKSSTTQRVNDLIQSLRNKRNKAIADSRVSNTQKKQTFDIRTPQKSQSHPISYPKNDIRTPPQSMKNTKQQQTTKAKRKDQQSSRAQKQKQLQREKQERQKAEKKQKEANSNGPESIFSLFGLIKGKNDQKGPQRMDSNPQTISNESAYTKFSGQSQYQVKVTSPHSSIRKIPNQQESDFLPVTIIGKMIDNPSVTMSKKKKQDQSSSQGSSISDNLTEIRKRIQARKAQEQNSNGSNSFKKKIPFKDIQKLFNEKEPQALKYLPKIELIKQNMKVGAELVKRIYNTCKNFENFFKLIEYMITSDTKFKEIIEQKSLTIVNQMQKTRGNVNLKEILPVQLFITISKSSLKDYYGYAFQMIKRNIVKALQKPDCNIHGLAVMIRYGFGSENSVYYQVYEEYINVLLRDFQINKYDDKKVFLLAQKMKNIYPNMNPDNREKKFIQLVQEMRDRQKKQKLVKSLYGALSKRSDIVSSQHSEEFNHTITQLIKLVKI